MFQQLAWQFQHVNAFSVYTTAAMALAAFLFFREIAQSPGMALLSLPVAMAGGILSTTLLETKRITLAYDPNANIAAMAGVGVIAAMILMIVVKWIWVILHERQIANTRLQSITPRSRRVRSA